MLEEKYEEYVETLPGQTVNSDGAFFWKPASDFSDFRNQEISGMFPGIGFTITSSRLSHSYYGSLYQCVPGSSIFVASDSSSDSPMYLDYLIVSPFDAWFTLVTDGFTSDFVNKPYLQGDSFSRLETNHILPPSVTFMWPEFLVTPFDSSISSFSSDTRVSAGNVSGEGNTGLYGYVQDGQLYQSTVGNIYNETTNIYQNPVTGETKDVSSWTYDYSDRSYSLNTEEGDTVTVTYGDTNVTINEGGTTYNVYYLAEHEDIPEHDYVASVTLEPTCTGTGVRTYTCIDCGDTYTETIPAKGHAYQSAVTLEPSCVNTGVRTFTCSECGDVYTVSIPATGHTWEVVRTVSTEFDENGQLLREGYTLYQCSVCGEQYKITADSGGSSLPSPSSGGTSTGEGSGTGLIEIDSGVGKGFLATIAHGLTEDLPEVLELFSQWFTKIPKLYDGYSKFLAASFAWMPSDCVMLLTFGVGMVVALAICRAMFRR